MIIITGPTSSGKTSLAAKLAQRFGAELISADSRQIYKYMDVGTGKTPIDNNLDGVKIHMYDVVDPDNEYSSFQYATDAREAMKNIELPIVVGGTGFYIDALASDSFDVRIDSDNKIRDELSTKSLKELTEMIPSDYLNTWNNSEKNNPSRLIRAIQIYKQTGKWPNKNRDQIDPSKNNLVIELSAPREFLYGRVDTWAQKIWEPLLAETEKLKKLGYYDALPLNGIIYRTAKSFLAGEINKEDALNQIKFDLHNYIRRQQTWFRKYKHTIKVDISKKSFDTEVFRLVESYLNER